MGSSIVPFNFKAVFYDKLCSRYGEMMLKYKTKWCFSSISTSFHKNRDTAEKSKMALIPDVPGLLIWSAFYV